MTKAKGAVSLHTEKLHEVSYKITAMIIILNGRINHAKQNINLRRSLASSSSTTSCKYWGGVRLTTLWIVRRIADGASLQNTITTLAVGSCFGYSMSLQLGTQNHQLLQNSTKKLNSTYIWLPTMLITLQQMPFPAYFTNMKTNYYNILLLTYYTNLVITDACLMRNCYIYVIMYVVVVDP